MKDNFSNVAQSYALYRPTYPNEVFDFIYKKVKRYDCAWDCGTGNGQVAIELAEKFQRVLATDISEKQIVHARKKDNITYKLIAAEKADFPDNYFDLITVGQAIHWFEFGPFYENVNRSLRSNGIFAVLGYGLSRIDDQCDAIVNYLYEDILGKYWDPERKYIEEYYQTIPFPFEEIDAPKFFHKIKWQLDDFVNYLQTWSAVQHYKRENNSDPVTEIKERLQKVWTGEKIVNFPILFRLGTKK